MLDGWIGTVIGELHIRRLTSKQLAREIGWNEKYLSQVLNGHKSPKTAEKKIFAALERLSRQSDNVKKGA